MTWQEARNGFPDRWLLIEAVEAHSEAGRRILDRLAVLQQFGDDGGAAMQGYIGMHHQFPQRELYILHTTRETPEIEERTRLMIRRTDADMNGVCARG